MIALQHDRFSTLVVVDVNRWDEKAGLRRDAARSQREKLCLQMTLHRAHELLVTISQSVFLATEFALCGWLGVVHQMMYRFESTQVGE
jgi:hypothetical protein